MARQDGIDVESKFIRGLITESQALSFPKDGCTETYDCVFDETGLVFRRPGLDLETGYEENAITQTAGEAFTEFVWSNVESDNDKTFLVQQQGSTVHFFDITTNTTPSANKHVYTLDLLDYIQPEHTAEVATWPCQYAEGRGRLHIVNRYHAPLLVRYLEETDGFSVTAVKLEYRDFAGVSDPFKVNERPTMTLAALKSSAPNHYYNLLNQGWYRVNASTTVLEQWDVDSITLPSNADVVGYFRNGVADTFDGALINQHQSGNSPAPKGHFILEVGVDNRNQAMLDEDFTGAYIAEGSAVSLVDISAETRISSGGFTNLANAFDLNSTTFATQTTFDTIYLGTNLSTPTKIAYALLDYEGTRPALIRLFGSNTAPASSADGTLLSSYDYSNWGLFGNTRHQVYLSHSAEDTYEYYWVEINTSAIDPVTDVIKIYEISLYIPEEVTYENNPSTISFMSGRIFYGGFSNPSIGSNVYFTQVIESDEQVGRCYQANDPTSDEIADLLATDGGVAKIPDANRIQRFFGFQNQLLVIASNGTWVIRGANGPFAATGYSISKISGVGSLSPLSVCDVKGLPVWWAEDGIYTVDYDARYDSVTLRSITQETIKSFITDIPALNRQYVKTAYDRLDDVAYWIYNDTANLTSSNYWTYNKILCLNIRSQAFYPWTISTSAGGVPQKAQGISYVVSADRVDTPSIKITATYNGKLTYTDFHNTTTYTDWVDYATLRAQPLAITDYVSYLISGYRIDGQAMKNFQAHYIQTFMKAFANSSAYVQGIYQFTNSGNSGKWSTPQQAYNSRTTRGRAYHDVKVTRNRIRGHGQALQLKYKSQSGKPFYIIGWGIYESANANV